MKLLVTLSQILHTTYKKLPEVVQFSIYIFMYIVGWILLVKFLSVSYQYLIRFTVVQCIEPYFDKALMVGLVALIAFLLVTALIRIVQLLRKDENNQL